MCAGSIEGAIDSCQGDSGGPLFQERAAADGSGEREYNQIGVVSWGIGCADAGYHGVYADVMNERGWIECMVDEATGTDKICIRNADGTGWASQDPPPPPACPNSCWSTNCDYWVYGAGGTCAELEADSGW